MSYYKCIDISNWQEGIDIDAALSKLDMAIFKASEGTGFIDKFCAGWVKAARKASKPFGVYHFFRGRGIAEADHFLNVCKDWVGKGVLILDVETEECSKVEVMAFVKRVHAKTGVWPWVYTSASFVSRFMNDYVKAHCGLWCAGYPTQPATWTKREFPYGGYTQGCNVVAWQFTDKLKIAGMAVDGNAVYITPVQWAKYANPKKSSKNKENGGKKMGLPLYEKFAQVMEHMCSHDGDSRTAHASLDNLNGTVKNCYVIGLLPPQSAAGDIGQRKRNRRKAGVPFLLAHKGFGEGTSPSRPQGRNSPRQGARHRNGV